MMVMKIGILSSMLDVIAMTMSCPYPFYLLPQLVSVPFIKISSDDNKNFSGRRRWWRIVSSSHDDDVSWPYPGFWSESHALRL